MSSLVKPTGEDKVPHPNLVRAAQLLAQARAIQEEFKDDPASMPAEVAHTQQQLLERARKEREAAERDTKLQDQEEWLREPQYKGIHPSGGERFGGGMPLIAAETKQRQAKAFWAAIRLGKDHIPSELKADLVLDPANGQLLVPEDFVGAIVKELPRIAVLRNLAFVRPTNSNLVDITDLTEGEIGWNKLELDAQGGAAEATPTVAQSTIEVHDLVGLVRFGRNLLEDDQGNLENVTRDLITQQFAEEEDNAFADGAGGTGKTGQPLGIARADFTGRTVDAGVAGTYEASELKSLKYRVSQRMRANGVYLAHSNAEEEVSLLVDGNGQFLWQPSVSSEEPATFAGKRWYTVDGLPGFGLGVVVFGDVRQGYMIADRRRMTVQRLTERFATEGVVGLLFTHRVGGGLIRENAFAAYDDGNTS